MCVKLPLRNLNPGSCSPYSTSTYTCEVTIVPKMRNGIIINIENPIELIRIEVSMTHKINGLENVFLFK